MDSDNLMQYALSADTSDNGCDHTGNYFDGSHSYGSYSIDISVSSRLLVKVTTELFWDEKTLEQNC